MTARARSRRKLNLGKLSPLRLRLPEDSQAPGPTWGKLGGAGRGKVEKERVENRNSDSRLFDRRSIKIKICTLSYIIYGR